MSDLASPVTPTASIVTSYKSNTGAAYAPLQPAAGGKEDHFGPAVIAPNTHLSGATLSAIKQTAAATTASTPALPTYDSNGAAQGNHLPKGTQPKVNQS